MECEKIYVCSPLRGDIEENIKRAKQYCKEITLSGNIPICPHVYFTQFLDDNIEEERNLGMSLGIELLKICSAVYVFRENGISSGMKAEIDIASSLGIPVILK